MKEACGSSALEDFQHIVDLHLLPTLASSSCLLDVPLLLQAQDLGLELLDRLGLKVMVTLHLSYLGLSYGDVLFILALGGYR